MNRFNIIMFRAKNKDGVFVEYDEIMDELEEKDEKIAQLEKMKQQAINIAVQYGSIDGGHHRMWVIDQMVRILTADEYEKVIRNACNGEDGLNTYEWDVGIAP